MLPFRASGPVAPALAARSRGAWLGWALAVGAVLAPLRAAAQECDDELLRAPLEVTPASGAPGVTLDAPVIVRYSRGYFDPGGPGEVPEELFALGVCPGACGRPCDLSEARPVEGALQVLGDRLVFVPAGGLEPGAQYVGLAIGIDDELPFGFCTGTRFDREAPEPPEFLAAIPEPSDASCVLPEGGNRVGLRFTPSTDDGPGGSLEYLLYLTRGHDVGPPELRDRYRNISSDEVVLRLLLTREQSREPVCVQVFAVDGVGRISEPTEEICVDPLTLAAFQPLCAVRAAGAGPRGPGAVPAVACVMVLALALARGRARRRGITRRSSARS